MIIDTKILNRRIDSTMYLFSQVYSILLIVYMLIVSSIILVSGNYNFPLAQYSKYLIFYEISFVFIFGYLGKVFELISPKFYSRIIRVSILATVYIMFAVILRFACNISLWHIFTSAVLIIPSQTYRILNVDSKELSKMVSSWQDNLAILMVSFVAVAAPLGLLNKIGILYPDSRMVVFEAIHGFWGTLYFLGILITSPKRND